MRHSFAAASAARIGALRDLLRDRRGNVAIIGALATPVLLGSFGLGTEVASWYAAKHAMQNAADSAAVAAATNYGETYGSEARAVAAEYGFRDGVDGVAITTSNTAPCPNGGANCFSVRIQKPYPLMLAQLVGYAGDGGANPARLISASATAAASSIDRPYCILATGADGTTPALRTNGAPKANLAGCNIMSNTDAECNGHDLQADIGDAAGTNDGCGVVRHSNVNPASDPFAAYASNIPEDTTCGGVFHQAPGKKGPPLPASNLLSGTKNWSGDTPVVVCGDVQLTADTIINSTGDGAVLIIRNGGLDTNGHTLQTAAGSALTVIFTGDNAAGYAHAPAGGGMIDIKAPTAGTWSGVALYQDPALTNGVDIDEAGNTPAWKITGAVYLPHSDVVFSGAVNKASNGLSCFVMVANSLLFNGTAAILAHGECSASGIPMPTSNTPSRGYLVS